MNPEIQRNLKEKLEEATSDFTKFLLTTDESKIKLLLKVFDLEEKKINKKKKKTKKQITSDHNEMDWYHEVRKSVVEFMKHPEYPSLPKYQVTDMDLQRLQTSNFEHPDTVKYCQTLIKKTRKMKGMGRVLYNSAVFNESILWATIRKVWNDSNIVKKSWIQTVRDITGEDAPIMMTYSRYIKLGFFIQEYPLFQYAKTTVTHVLDNLEFLYKYLGENLDEARFWCNWHDNAEAPDPVFPQGYINRQGKFRTLNIINKSSIRTENDLKVTPFKAFSKKYATLIAEELQGYKEQGPRNSLGTNYCMQNLSNSFVEMKGQSTILNKGQSTIPRERQYEVGEQSNSYSSQVSQYEDNVGHQRGFSESTVSSTDQILNEIYEPTTQEKESNNDNTSVSSMNSS